jgi:glycerophosphoryl diester phosphodiesterase
MKPLIWAHRGASGCMPENTLPAFKKAIEMGADGVELDIQLTRDGEIVVCHDETIDRTSNGTGFLKDYTLAQLRRFNFNKTHPEVEHADIPTMKEVFELIRPTSLTINIELKTGVFFYEGIEEKIVHLTHEMGMADRVIYSSFNHYSILRIQQLDPQARTAFLYSDGFMDMPAYGQAHYVSALHPWFGNIRYPDFMKECREKGLEVNVWTVNEEQYIEMCAQAGVHAIITNVPDHARAVLNGSAVSSAYKQYMDSEVRPWLKDHVQALDIFNGSGLRLRVYAAVNPQEKASVVLIHGFCEFFGKYHEMAYRLYQEGYSVFFGELRGHGDSQRSTPYEDSRVGISNLDEYVEDVNAVVEQVAKVQSKTGRLYLFAHSLGGAVGALYLEKYPRDFLCAALSSPMLKIDFRGIPKTGVRVLEVYSNIVKNDDDFAPKQGPFTGQRDFENSSAMDRDRYNYQFDLRLENPKYQTWGGTWGWVKASMEGGQRAIDQAGKIQIPVRVFQAGDDTMVDNEGQLDFVKNDTTASLNRYPGAKHELFNASDEIRERYYKDLFAFYHSFD